MPGGEAAPSSTTRTEAAAAGGPPQADDAASLQPPEASREQSGEASSEDGAEGDLSRCPICQFIEAGECKAPHQTWVACRTEAKAAGKDYIEECQDHFKAFLQCAIDHRDYYEPFLEMLGGLPDDDAAGEGEGEGERAAKQGQGQGDGGERQGEGEMRPQQQR